MLHKLIAVSMIAATIVGLAIMQFTTPATIHPIGLLVFFVCVYVVVLGSITYGVFIGARLLVRYAGSRREQLSLWRSYQFATVVALAPVMLLAMRTVGPVTVLDGLFIGLFVIVAVFYIAKRG